MSEAVAGVINSFNAPVIKLYTVFDVFWEVSVMIHPVLVLFDQLNKSDVICDENVVEC